MDWTFRRLHIPFRLSIKQASAVRHRTDAIWAELHDPDTGLTGLGEGCPRPYQTGEDTRSALRWLEARREVFSGLSDLDALRAFVGGHEAELDQHPAAWCAVELALLDLFAQREGGSVEALLGVSESRTTFQFSAVVGDATGPALHRLVARFVEAGLSDFKFKLSGALGRDVEKLETLRSLADPFPRVRVDANALWGRDPCAAVEHLRALPGPIRAIEEPLAPGLAEGCAAIHRALDVPIVLDESLLRPADVPRFDACDGAWIGSVKVSKNGGLLRTLALIDRLRETGWPVVVSAQTGETSVLTRAGLVAARAAGGALYAHEGGLGTLLLEHDPVVPELRMGARGRMHLPTLIGANTGWGFCRETRDESETDPGARAGALPGRGRVG